MTAPRLIRAAGPGGYAISLEQKYRRIVEGEMESFWGSVELMVFVYALAAVVSFLVAWVIKLIFAGIKMQKARAEARVARRAKTPAGPGNAAPEGAD